jgi:hypothetical protein
MAIAAALALVGPGRISVDHALGVRLSRWIGFLGLVGILFTVGRAMQPATPLLQTGETFTGEPSRALEREPEAISR